MANCKDCGGLVITDTYLICSECGILQDSKSQIENSVLVPEVTSVFLPTGPYVNHHEVISTISFKKFKELYLSITYTLCSPYKIVEKGKQLLPQLYKTCRLARTRAKFGHLSALLYLLHKEENSFTIKQFEQQIGLHLPHFTRHLQIVRKNINFISFKNHDNLNHILDSISKLSKIALKPNIMKTIEISQLVEISNRLAKVIHSKSWMNSSVSTMSYIDQISAVSVILASHYCIACTSRKGARGKKKSFRYSCIQLDKIAEFSTITKRCLWVWIRLLQEQLYKVYRQMHLKPSSISNHREIGVILVELLDYIDLDLYEDVEKTEEDIQEFMKAKSYLLHSLDSFLSKQKVKGSQDLSFETFLTSLNKEKKENKNSNYKYEIELTKTCMSMGPHLFHLEHVDLMKTLLLHGCTVEELETDQISKLIRTYIESKTPHEEDDSNLSDVDDGLDVYIKDAEEIEKEKYQWLLSNDI